MSFVTAPHTAFMNTSIEDFDDAVWIITAEIYDAELDACLEAM